MIGGEEVYLYRMCNDRGMTCAITNYGGIITSVNVPDRNGEFADVVLGFDNLAQYRQPHPYFGAIVGRVANRIAYAKFHLNGSPYLLSANDGAHALHGGRNGFDKRVWKVAEVRSDNATGLTLSYLSPHLEEGFPGNLSVHVTYMLTNENTLSITYRATTDQATLCNLSQHSYFNLGGHGSGTVLDHEIMINATHYTPVGEGLIPTGEIAAVASTPFDMQEPVTIRSALETPHEQLVISGGIDHSMVLDNSDMAAGIAAEVYHPGSGRTLVMRTTERAVQLYTGNFLDGSIKGKSGVPYERYSGFCLETQGFPDAPNQCTFPSVVLNAGDTYASSTDVTFGSI